MLDGKTFKYPAWADAVAMTRRWTNGAEECLTNMRDCDYDKRVACSRCTVQLTDLKANCHMFYSVLATFKRLGEPCKSDTEPVSYEESLFAVAKRLFAELTPHKDGAWSGWLNAAELKALSKFKYNKRYFLGLMRSLVTHGLVEMEKRPEPSGKHSRTRINYYRLLKENNANGQD